jgi:hypothetical protein
MSDAALSGPAPTNVALPTGLADLARSRMFRPTFKESDRTAFDYQGMQQLAFRSYAPPPINDGKSLFETAPNSANPEIEAIADQTRLGFLKTNFYGMQGSRMSEADSKPGQLVARLFATPLTRYQGDVRRNTWEKIASGNFYHYTFFPAVSRTQDQIHVMSYAVVYSNFPVGAWTYTRPEYKKFFHEGGSSADDYVMVDTALLGDQNIDRTIVAALNNCHPAPKTYLTIIPMVSQEEHDAVREAGARNPFRLSGASCGCAIFAAVMGMASVHYTGYVKAIAPNTVISKDPMWMSKSDRGVNVSLNFGGWGADGVATVGKTYDFVEAVDLLDYKILWAVRTNTPIVMPTKTTDGMPLAAVARNHPSGAFRTEMLPYVMTMASAYDNKVNYLEKPTPLLIGVTITDYAVLGAYAMAALSYKKLRDLLPQTGALPVVQAESSRYMQFATAKLKTEKQSSKEQREIYKKAGKTKVERKAAARARAAKKAASDTAARKARSDVREQILAERREEVLAEDIRREKEKLKRPPSAGADALRAYMQQKADDVRAKFQVADAARNLFVQPKKEPKVKAFAAKPAPRGPPPKTVRSAPTTRASTVAPADRPRLTLRPGIRAASEAGLSVPLTGDGEGESAPAEDDEGDDDENRPRRGGRKTE